MAAFLHLLDDLGAEGLEVAGVARSDHALIDDHFRILPSGAGIGDIGLDRLVGRHLPAMGDAGFDQQPGRMTNRSDDFLGVEDVLDEFKRLGLDAKQVGIDLAPRQNDGVVIRCLRVVERLVDLDRPAPVLLVPALDLAAGERDDFNSGARLLQAVARDFEFGLFEAVGS